MNFIPDSIQEIFNVDTYCIFLYCYSINTIAFVHSYSASKVIAFKCVKKIIPLICNTDLNWIRIQNNGTISRYCIWEIRVDRFHARIEQDQNMFARPTLTKFLMYESVVHGALLSLRASYQRQRPRPSKIITAELPRSPWVSSVFPLGDIVLEAYRKPFILILGR